MFCPSGESAYNVLADRRRCPQIETTKGKGCRTNTWNIVQTARTLFEHAQAHVMFERMKQPEQAADLFLAGCGISPNTSAAMLALEVRNTLAQFASPSRHPSRVFCDHRIETDLGMHHVDSLDLVDMSLTLESVLGMDLDDTDKLMIFEKQKDNCTVADFVAVLLGFTNEERT
jgi:acyl carrier protein